MKKNQSNKEKKPFYKKWWFWGIIALVLMYRIGSSITPTETTNASIEASVEESSVDTSIEGQLTAILDELNIKYSDLKIVQGTPDTDRYNITYHYDESSWDETHFVDDCLSDYIDLCNKAYQIDGINNIQLYVFTDLMDAKGNPTTEKGFAMSMTKEKYDTYSWENIQYLKGKYDLIEADSEFIDIHPGIRKNVNFDEVMYK